MKKFLTVLAVFALVFAGCEEDIDGGYKPPVWTYLKIKNESSTDINEVKWNGKQFYAYSKSIFNPGENGRGMVDPGQGYVFFTIFSVNSGTTRLRTSALVIVEEGKDEEFSILNSTVVVDLDTNDTGPLSEFIIP